MITVPRANDVLTAAPSTLLCSGKQIHPKHRGLLPRPVPRFDGGMRTCRAKRATHVGMGSCVHATRDEERQRQMHGRGMCLRAPLTDTGSSDKAPFLPFSLRCGVEVACGSWLWRRVGAGGVAEPLPPDSTSDRLFQVKNPEGSGMRSAFRYMILGAT